MTRAGRRGRPRVELRESEERSGLVIFDIDGTLLDNHAVEDACFAVALRETLGLPDLDTNWAHYPDVSDDGIAAEAYRLAHDAPLPASARAAAINRFVELLHAAIAEEGIQAVRGADVALEALERAGWGVALATGAWASAARAKLAAAGLAYETRVLATSEDGPARTDIVRSAIRLAEAARGGVGFDRVVCVGDGVWDVEAARRLELPFVGVGAGTRRERLLRAGATVVLADFGDMRAVQSALAMARPPVPTSL